MTSSLKTPWILVGVTRKRRFWSIVIGLSSLVSLLDSSLEWERSTWNLADSLMWALEGLKCNSIRMKFQMLSSPVPAPISMFQQVSVKLDWRLFFLTQFLQWPINGPINGVIETNRNSIGVHRRPPFTATKLIIHLSYFFFPSFSANQGKSRSISWMSPALNGCVKLALRVVEDRESFISWRN